MRAIGYILTTQDEPENEGHQYQKQFEAITAYCSSHDHNLIKVFSDSGTTGNSGNGYLNLLDFIDTPNQASMVVVTGADSLGTSLEQAINSILQIDYYGSTAVCSSAEYPDPIQNALSIFRTERSEQIRGAMLERASEGKALGRPAYGYQISDKRTLTPNPEETLIVKRIFAMYLQEGIGLRRIVDRLNGNNELGRNDKQWTIAQILAILRNPVYIGTYRRFGLRMPNNHEAIISTGDFTSTQQLMRSRRTYKSKRQQQIYPLSGLLQCKHCNGRMIGFSRKQSWRRKDGSKNQKTYRYYYCPSRLGNPLCRNNVTSAEQWDRSTATCLYDYFLKHPARRVISDGWSASNTDSPSVHLSEPSSFSPNLQRRWMKALRLTASGSLTLGDLRRITTELQYLNSGVGEEEYASVSRVIQIEDLDLWQAMSAHDHKVLFNSFIHTVVPDAKGPVANLLNGDYCLIPV